MRTHHKRRLFIVLFITTGAGLTVASAMFALRESVDLYYPPVKIIDGTAPVGIRIRAGGMVEASSIEHEADGLGVRFVLTDLQGSKFTVHFNGILPGLFREGQGTLVSGKLSENGVFLATEVLAKHDENYVPPELHDL